VPHQSGALRDGALFEIGGMTFEALHIPGHTLGAVAYRVEDAAFTGDTLFVAGCGRLFEGTAEMMHRSLNERLAVLPDATRIYCGHEYTLSNLRFAATVEPDSEAVRARIAWALALRQAGRATVPSTMGDERATNPFLRVHLPTVASHFGGGSPAEVLGAVRRAKDTFR
jgi:hydroxyacylglutathione hydrolase